VLVAIGGWALAIYTLRRNEKIDADKRAQQREEAAAQLKQEREWAEQRLRDERETTEKAREKQRDAENGARIESFLVDSLKYLQSGGGSRDRILGLAFIEAYWDDFRRLQSVWTSVVTGQVLRYEEPLGSRFAQRREVFCRRGTPRRAGAPARAT